jgi:hypothetical protein
MGEICQCIFVRFAWRISPANAAKDQVNITLPIQRIKSFIMYAMARGRYPTSMKKIIEYSQIKKSISNI